jgi:histidinol-phosphate aminotransferase
MAAEAPVYLWQDGVPDGPVDRFDMNTPPDPPRWYAREVARLLAVPPNDYPHASYRSLREAVAEYAGVHPEQVVIGAGCDEILLLAARVALRPGERMVATAPTYSLYGVAAAQAGGELLPLPPLDESLALDWDGLEAAATSASAVVVCSPNNPTGEVADPERVAALCRACPGVVIADQAYLEFGGEDLARLLDAHHNLLVARTFSKGFALAGVRVGYALASQPLAGDLDRLRPPASVSSVAAAVAELACGHADEMREDCRATVARRIALAGGLRIAGASVVAQGGNFVLVRDPVPDTAARLRDQGLMIRTFPTEPSLEGHFRVTVSHPAAEERLLAAVAALAGGRAPAPSGPRLDGRSASVRRVTSESEAVARLALDGEGRVAVATGLGFLDHLIGALAFWSLIDLELRCRGDLWVDEHHTVEDCAIALGQALDAALGNRAGLRRFGTARAPLDEALATATVDLSGRGVAQVDLGLRGPAVGQVPTTLLPHFLDTLARRAGVGLHVEVTGEDDHHRAEAAFKAVGLALRTAVSPDPRRTGVPSTKGTL